MRQGQTLKYSILFFIAIQCVSTFEILIAERIDGIDQNIQHLGENVNKSYEIPLFQTRYVTVRVHTNDLHRHGNNRDGDIVGFKFQIKSSVLNVVGVEKELNIPAEGADIDDRKSVLVEDLFILPRKKALAHVLNAYPAPSLIPLNQRSSKDVVINSVWAITGIGMDTTTLTFRLDIFHDDDRVSQPHIRTLNVLIIQPKRRVDTIFYIILPFMVITISILMGTLLDTKKIRDILKNPKPVIVGFIAQYGLMPFLAMAIAKIFRYSPLHSLALFVIGCCPGSGASNQWTVIFDGDVNLSAVMSFVSTTASFIMMPLYFYTIGRVYTDDLKITVPFLGLARSLTMVVVPYGLGILINHFFPKTGQTVAKMIKPMMIGLMLFFLTFGVFVNWYLFQMIDLYTTLTAPLLPFLGFIFGGIIARIALSDWKLVKTIGIEAGIQNTGIAFMIFIYSFPQPYATQAMIVPMVVAFLSTKPFWLILLIRNQVQKYQKRKELEKSRLNGNVTNNDDISTLNGVVINNDEKPTLNAEKNHVAETMQHL